MRYEHFSTRLCCLIRRLRSQTRFAQAGGDLIGTGNKICSFRTSFSSGAIRRRRGAAARSKCSIRTTTRRSPRSPKPERPISTKRLRPRPKRFPPGAALAAADRGRLLLKLADAIEAHAEELAQVESLDTGHPIRDTRMLDVPRTAATFRYFGGMADKLQGQRGAGGAGISELRRARAAGRGRSDRAVEFSDDVHELEDGAGAGRRQLRGAEAGRADAAQLAQNRGADARGRLSARRGQHRAGLRERRGPVPRRASAGAENRVHRIDRDRAQNRARPPPGNLKRVQLELGGKGANIVFDDADLDAAVNGSAFAIFHNQGQACIAGSRLLLHEKIADKFLDALPEAGGVDQARQSARSGRPRWGR